ncbi:MAG: hypothetical protein AAB263_05375, partial [Planctomycetota bacterium]
IEGQPWFDTASAVRAWRLDRQLQGTTYQRVGTRTLTTTGADEDPALDIAEAIAAADLLVVGLEPKRLLTDQTLEVISKRVRGGVGLLLLGGWRASDDPMATYDPVLWGDQANRQLVTPTLAAAGERLALAEGELLARMPQVPVAAAAGLRPLATVAIGDAQRPLLVIGRHGAGRTACLNGDGLWRWNHADPQLSERLWRQVAKTLAAGAAPPLAADRERYRVGAQARIAVTGSDAAAMTVTAPDGTTASVPITDGVAVITMNAAGRWRLARGVITLTLVADEDAREFTDDARRDERLARLAATTGGRALLVTQATELGSALARRADLQVGAPRRIPLVVAWWWWVVIAGAFLGWEWWLRRRTYGRV